MVGFVSVCGRIKWRFGSRTRRWHLVGALGQIRHTSNSCFSESGDRQRLEAAFEVVEGGGLEGRTLEKFPRRLAAFGGEAAVLVLCWKLLAKRIWCNVNPARQGAASIRYLLLAPRWTLYWCLHQCQSQIEKDPEKIQKRYKIK